MASEKKNTKRRKIENWNFIISLVKAKKFLKQIVKLDNLWTMVFLDLDQAAMIYLGWCQASQRISWAKNMLKCKRDAPPGF